MGLLRPGSGLWAVDHDRELEQRARKALRAGYPVATANPFGFSGHIWLLIIAAQSG
jgi:hypothetical protein